VVLPIAVVIPRDELGVIETAATCREFGVPVAGKSKIQDIGK
jgi:hypothetical protein